MDVHDKETRSYNMSRIRRKDTQPEVFVRKLLFKSGYRYRLQSNKIPGHPDLWMKKYNTAIFVHGCFWHRHKGCPYAYMPKSNVDFWNSKFKKNMERDHIVLEQLKAQNIRCLVIWECTIKKAQKKAGDPLLLLNMIEDFFFSGRMYQEI